jgi:mevalonate kinase
MPAITATAPGKIILFGEHAVVYGRPAIAAPVSQVQARAVVSAEPRKPPGLVGIQAPDIGLEDLLDNLPETHPLACIVRAVLMELGVARPPACSLRITSTIPVAAGLGSGAAVSVAVARALSAFLGRPLPDDRVSALAFDVEKLHHGTPSGIDNTVVTYEKPVYYLRGQPLQTLRVSEPFRIVIGDTGIPSPTAVAVGDVRQVWIADRLTYEGIFDEIGRISEQARLAIEGGKVQALGPLMDENHRHLQRIGVSSRELDLLVEAARGAGASGAKLSGAGRGGNMIALVEPDGAASVADALQKTGARHTIVTIIG